MARCAARVVLCTLLQNEINVSLLPNDTTAGVRLRLLKLPFLQETLQSRAVQPNGSRLSFAFAHRGP